MELHPENGAERDRTRERFSIIRRRGDDGCVVGNSRKRVCEIEVCRRRENRTLADGYGRVPPDMRKREPLRTKAPNTSAKNSEPTFAWRLVALFEEDLEPETDPKVRPIGAHALGKHLSHSTGHRACERAEGALAGNDDDVR